MSMLITNVNAPVRRGTPNFPCWDVTYDSGVRTRTRTFFKVEQAYDFYAFCRRKIAEISAAQQNGR